MVLDNLRLPGGHLRRMKLWMLGLALLGGMWLYGLARFVAADGHIEVVLPRRRTPPAQRHNFSLWDLGPTIRASSFYGDWLNMHHPAFLVDGMGSPDLEEKWASAESDRHPWVEIVWRESHDLERVVIHHAGSVENPDYTVRRYTVHCLTTHGPGPSLDVSNNTLAVAVHDLACKQARGIRIDFEPNNDKDIVRVFEVETWGR